MPHTFYVKIGTLHRTISARWVAAEELAIMHLASRLNCRLSGPFFPTRGCLHTAKSYTLLLAYDSLAGSLMD